MKVYFKGQSLDEQFTVVGQVPDYYLLDGKDWDDGHIHAVPKSKLVVVEVHWEDVTGECLIRKPS